MKKTHNFFGVAMHPLSDRANHEIVAKPAASVEAVKPPIEEETDQPFERPRIIGFYPYIQGVSVTRQGRSEVIFPHCEHKAQCYTKRKSNTH